MQNKQKRFVRIMCILLAVLLGGSAVFSAIFSLAYGEEALPAQNSCALTMEYLEKEQALHVEQRLVYTNTSSIPLNRVVFYAPANLFRRESALLYAVENPDSALPYGYMPGGIDLMSVQVNGKAADYGFQGENEIYLRVSCALQPGESCTFAFDYFLLLTANRAFLGLNETDVRLSAFYFAPAYVDETYGEFMLSSPTSFTRWLHTPAMDFTAEITLSDRCVLAGTGVETGVKNENGDIGWEICAESTRDLALSFGDYKFAVRDGIFSCRTNRRGAAEEVIQYVKEAVAACERWFGPFPMAQMDFVESGDAEPFRVNSGCAWLAPELLKTGGDELRRAVFFCIAQQYFGMTAYARPGADAWLSDAVCEYLSYLILEESDGHEAYLRALNENIVPSLQLTIPGGLNVVSDAALFSDYEYKIVVKDRGAAVFHELRTAMARDALLAGLKLFYEKGLHADVLSETDLVNALDAASGASWEAFLTDWLYNIGDYVNQEIAWLD